MEACVKLILRGNSVLVETMSARIAAEESIAHRDLEQRGRVQQVRFVQTRRSGWNANRDRTVR